MKLELLTAGAKSEGQLSAGESLAAEGIDEPVGFGAGDERAMGQRRTHG